MKVSRRTRGGIGLFLVAPLLAAYAVARLWAVLVAVSTGSIVAYVGYPGGATAELPFSAADRPFYFGVALLDSATGAIAFGGGALVVAIASWWRLRNVSARMLSSARSANWGRFWSASSLAWLMLTAAFPILAFFSII
ncbi:MAG TPA: hypothetical protein VJQ47_02810 [Steroidobacteraceae bacterium]|nr:hypothetical protein [Steroidobacteraceae bacterium]